MASSVQLLKGDNFILRLPTTSTISREEFAAKYWPQISALVLRILTDPQPQKLSHEECYRLVYKICQSHAEELWRNLERTINEYLDNFRDILTSRSTSPEEWMQCFSTGFLAYQEGIRILPLIFQYLERVYLAERLGTKLSNELTTKMRRWLNVPSLTSLLRGALPHCTTRTLPPSAMHRLLPALAEYNRTLTRENIPLFSVHVPGLVPGKGPIADRDEARELWGRTLAQCADRSDMVLTRPSTSLLGKRKFEAM